MLETAVDYATEGQCILRTWHCARTTVGRERGLAEALEALRVEIFLPTEREKIVYRAGQKYIEATGRYVDAQIRARTRPAFFPGYLFACLGDYEWAAVKTRLGVALRPRWVDFGCGPVEVPVEYIAQLRLEQDERASGRPVEMKIGAGQPVAVMSGPYAGHSGIFNRQLSGAERVEVLMQVLGAMRPVELVRSDIQVQTGWSS